LALPQTRISCSHWKGRIGLISGTYLQDGRAILTNVVRRTALYHLNFKSQVFDIQFAPNGKLFAVGAGRNVEVWKVPTIAQEREFAPFVRHRVYTGHFNSVSCITWSEDSRFFLTSAKDLTARIFSVDPVEGFVATTLGGHKDHVIGAYFSEDQETVSMIHFSRGVLKVTVSLTCKYPSDIYHK